MAIGDGTRLRAARADLARTRLETTKQQGGIADLLGQLASQAERRTTQATKVATEQQKQAEREEFERFRGEFGLAVEAGTVTPEMNRRALELGLKRPDIVRPEKPLRETQILADELAALDRKILAGTATDEERAKVAELRASRRAPVADRPTDIEKTVGSQRFKAFEEAASTGAGAETPEELARIQQLPLQVGTFIAQLGFDNFNQGFGELSQALEVIVPEAESDLERIELLFETKKLIDKVLRGGSTPQAQRSVIGIFERDLAQEVGVESAQRLVDFILKAGR